MRLHLREKQRHLTIEVQRDGDHYHLTVDGTPCTVEAAYVDASTIVLTVGGLRYRIAIASRGRERLVSVEGEVYAFAPETPDAAHHVESVAAPEIVAPMPGKILQVLVQAGDCVADGDPLLLLEAMKMETRLVAEAAGTVDEVRVAPGDMVNGGQVLVVLRYD